MGGLLRRMAGCLPLAALAFAFALQVFIMVGGVTG